MSERATLSPARLDAFRKEVRDKLSVAFYHGQSRRGVRDGVVMKQCEDFLVEQATELAAAPAAGEGTDALTDAERDELDTLLGAVLLPTFTPRERDIARLAARAALRASAPPAPDGADGDSMAPATRKDAARPAMVDGNASIESPSARTALGEPPTGMREVPGTPGLYETGVDRDALAMEIWRRLKSKVVPLRIYPDPQPEIVAIIRAALDRVKETR